MENIRSTIQLIIGVIGFFSTIGMYWLGKSNNWSDEFNMVSALMIAVGTLLIEIGLSFTSLKQSIEKLYPVLELSAEEQKNIHQSILLNNQLQQQRGEPKAEIALNIYNTTIDLLKNAVDGSDFFTDNIFQANLLTLKCMKQGQTFKGLSALINPDYWEHDSDMQEYKKINYEKVKLGVVIKRIFLFKDDDQYLSMKTILQEQFDNGIEVYYCLKNKISHINHYPDFTSVKDLNFAIIVPREEKLQTVTLTSNKHTIAELESQFTKILNFSTKFEGIY